IQLHLLQKPLPPHTLNPDLPHAISSILLKCLAKEPEQRYRSAYGVVKDLEECFNALKSNEILPDFIPGRYDLYDHFQFSDKMYGREVELAQLGSLLNEVLGGAKRLCTITGPSGIGKSTLVDEARKNLKSKRGRFIKARFEQYQRNSPYHGFIEAIR